MTSNQIFFERALAECPVVAILRGITPAEIVEITEILWKAGIRIVEVPLNSPDPFTSIGRLRVHFADRLVIGAGTVLDANGVKSTSDAGGQIIVAPNTDQEVIAASLALGCVPIPGIATATEAFGAIKVGARCLKLFPADVMGRSFLSSLDPVLPSGIKVLAVGGVQIDNAASFIASGFDGVGTGSGLYKPSKKIADIAKHAADFVLAAKAGQRKTDACCGEDDAENKTAGANATHSKTGWLEDVTINQKPATNEQSKTRQSHSSMVHQYVETVDRSDTYDDIFRSVRCLSDVKADVGEGPVHYASHNEIIWVDASKPRLFRYNLLSGTTQKIEITRQLSKVIMRTPTELYGIGSKSVYRLDVNGKIIATMATIRHLNPGCRLNDAAVDQDGQLWIGSMHGALLSGQGQVFRVRGDGQVRVMGGGFGVCNGLGFSPDGSVLYMVDTLFKTLIAFDISISSDQRLQGRIISDFMNVPGKPDGLAVCQKGHIWVAMWGGGCVVEILPTGQIHRRINLPTPHPNALVFVQGHTASIFITTSRMRLNDRQLSAAPYSGELLQVDI